MHFAFRGWSLVCAFAFAACTTESGVSPEGGMDAAGAEGAFGPGAPGAPGTLAPGPIIQPRVRHDAGVDAATAGPADDAGGEDDGGSSSRDAGGPCGNGKLDSGEACDPGKDACCNARCTGPRRAGAICRLADGACDVGEACDGASVKCPVDALRKLGFVCRPADGACDVAEICNGASKNCPTDTVAPGAGSVMCGASTGAACDADDYCDGSGKSCPDLVAANSTQCATTTGAPCDADDYCDGSAKSCPDLFAPSSQQCGSAGPGLCDLDDYCSGTSTGCPDAFKTSAVVCRPAAGAGADADCDLPESCTGTGAACPPDMQATEFSPCGDASADDCDFADSCDGFGGCLARHADVGTACTDTDATDCNDAQCDGEGTCDQSYATEPNTHVCRASAGPCDVEDKCDGDGRVCPADAFEVEGQPCGDIETDTECNHADSCDDSGNCATNVESAGVPCGDQEANDECNAPDACDGTGGCDPNYAPAMAPCGDSKATECSKPDACDGSGACDPLHEPVQTPCGDRIDDVCTKPDECDGDGTCDPKHQPDATPCTMPMAPPASDTGMCSAGMCCPGLTVNDGTGCDFPAAEEDVVFVTSVPLTPDFGGVGGGDAACTQLAQYANLRGTFHAWLSDTSQDAKDRVGDGPYRRVDNVLVDADKPALLANPQLAPIEKSELNTLTQKAVWTNTNDQGIRMDQHCNDWTSASMPEMAYVGGSYNYTSQWSWMSVYWCSSPDLRLYCFQDDCPSQPDVDFKNDPLNCGACGNVCATGYCVEGTCAGRVFATSQGFDGNLGGVLGADAKCNMLAQAAELPGDYVALLSETGTPTWALYRIADQAYYRVDGVKVADGLLDVFDGSLDAAISLSELGVAPPGFQLAWTGSYYTGTPGMKNCQNWTSSAAAPTTGDYGIITQSGAGWAQVSGGAACDTLLSLYCFQVGPSPN